MVELSRAELIKELEEEAEKIHNSTRVDIPLFSPVHNYLRSKSETYYNWSISPKSSNIHRTAALGFVISVFFFTFIQFVFPNLFLPKVEKAFAASSQYSWPTNAAFSTATTNSQVDYTSAPNNVKLATTQSFGDGSDGQLIVDGTTVGATKVIKPDNSVITLGCGSTPNTSIVCNASNPLYLDVAYPKSNNKFNFTTITLQNSAVLTHSVMSSAKGGIEGIELYANGSITVSNNSSIDVSFRSAMRSVTGGGGYAASGGAANAAGNSNPIAGGAAYGDPVLVQQMGSAGNYAGYNSGFCGYGGGRVALISPTVNIAGSVNANGAGSCTFTNTNVIFSGGSGGGILFKAGTVNLSGSNYSISAAGGGGGIGIGAAGSNGSLGKGGQGAGGQASVNPGIGGAGGNAPAGAGGPSAGGGAQWNVQMYAYGGGGAAGRIGISAAIVNNSSISSITSTYANPAAALNKIGPYAYYNYLTPYYTTGTMGAVSDNGGGLLYNADPTGTTGVTAYASGLQWTATTSATGNQKVLFKVRAANTTAGLNTASCYGPGDGVTSGLGIDSACNDWTTTGKFFSQIGSATSPGSPVNLDTVDTSNIIPAAKYIEILVNMSSDGTVTPTLGNITLSYNYLDSPTSLAQYKSNGTTQISNNWTNETSFIAKGNVGTPFSPSSKASPITPQFEVRTTDSGWTGSPANASGISVTPNNISYTCVSGSCTALGVQSLGTISGLSQGTTYYYRVRTTDAAGRVSGWSASSQVVYTDITVPTITNFTVKSAATGSTQFVDSTRMISVAGGTGKTTIFDTGGSSINDSGTVKIQLSEDGASWGYYDSGSGTNIKDSTASDSRSYKTITPSYTAQSDIANAWKIEGGEGNRQVYIRAIDNAGNITGSGSTGSWDTKNDFNGTTQGSATTLGGNIDLNTTVDSIQLTPAGTPTVTANYGYGGDSGKTTAGSYTLTIPSSVTAFNVEVDGAGGGGDDASGATGHPGSPATSMGISGNGSFLVTANSGSGNAAQGTSSIAGFTGGISGQTGGGNAGGAGSTIGGGQVYDGWCYFYDYDEWDEGYSEQGCIDSGGEPEYTGGSTTGATGGVGGKVSGAITSSQVSGQTLSIVIGPGGAGGDAGVGTAGSPGAMGSVKVSYTYTLSGAQQGTLGATGTGLRYGDAVNGAQQKWSNLHWTGSGLNSGNKIGIKVRAADSYGSGSYVNPFDNTNSFYWITSGTSGDIVLSSSIAQTKTIEVQLELDSDGSSMPKLDFLSVSSLGTNVSTQITLDTQPPTITSGALTAPNGNEKWLGGSSKTITWDNTKVTDANILANPITLSYSTDGTNYTQIATGLPNNGTYTWNPVPSLNSNNVTIKLQASDSAGNSTSDVSDQSFTIDSTIPTAGAQALNQYYNTSSFSVPYTSADGAQGSGVANVKLYYTTQTSAPYTWTQFGGTFTSSPINFTGATTNHYGFRFVATDNVALMSEADPPATSTAPQVTTIDDQNLPASTISNSGAYGGIHRPWPNSVSGSSSDTGGSNISKVEVLIKDQLNNTWDGNSFTAGDHWLQATGTTSWSYPINDSNMTDGFSYTIESRATDNATNLQSPVTNGTFSFVTSAPTGSFTISNGATYTTSLSVLLRFSTNTGNVDKMMISDNADFSADGLNSDSGNWIAFSQGPKPWILPSGDGDKTVYFKLLDFAGNESQPYSQLITLDTTRPVSTITSPANSAQLNSVTSISGTVTEAGSGITNAPQINIAITKDGLFWNGGIFDSNEQWLPVTALSGTKPDFTWTYTDALPDWSNGDYTIQVSATDDAGKIETPSSGNTFRFDNTGAPAPTVSSSTHGDSQLWYTNTSPNFLWSDDDSTTGNTGIAGYSYVLDQTADTVPADTNMGSGTSTSFSGKADGTWYFHIKALDGAGNWGTTQTFTLNIDTIAPIEDSNNPFIVNGIDDTKIKADWGKFIDNGAGPKEYKLYRATIKTNPSSTATSDPNIDPLGLTYTNLVTTVTDNNSPTYSYTDTALTQGWYYYRLETTDKSNPSNGPTYTYSHSKTNFIPNDINLLVNNQSQDLAVNPSDPRTLNLSWSATDPDGAADIVTTKVTVKNPDGSVYLTFNQSDQRMVRTSTANGFNIAATINLPTNLAYGNYTYQATTIDTIALGSHTKNSTNTVTVHVIPNVPTNVTASGYTSTSSQLNWVAPPNNGLRPTNTYQVQRKLSTDSDSSFADVNPAFTAATSFTDNNLTMQTTYIYRVRAVDVSSNNGPWATSTEATTPKPAVPDQASVKDASSSNVSLGGTYPVRYLVSWNQVNSQSTPDFKGYKVFRSENGVWDPTPITQIDCTSLGFNQTYFLDLHSSADQNKVFQYRVSSWDQSGNIGDAVETLSTVQTQAPQLVTQPTATETGVSWVKLTWKSNQSSAGIIKYRKVGDNDFISFAGDPNITTVQDNGSYVHTATVRGLDKGTSYDFIVMDLNQTKLLSNESSPVTASTKSFDIASVNKATTATGATITWSTGDVTSEGYIEYKKGNDSAKVAGTGTDDTNHSVTLSSLDPGDYVFTLKNIDSEGNITTSNLDSFTITGYDTGALSSPQAGQIQEKDITATSAKITWSSTVPTSSWVEYGTSSGNYTNQAGNNTLSIDHVVTLEALVPGTTYYYIVKGTDTNNVEYKSKEVSFTAQSKPGISEIRVFQVAPYTARVSVTATKDVEASFTYGKNGNMDLKAGDSTIAKVHDIELTKLEDNTIYTYYVDIKDNQGNTVKSDQGNFTTPLDTTPANIKDVKLTPLSGSDTSKRGIIITWTTDKETTSQVAYSSGITAGKYTLKSPEDQALSLSHTVVINSLDPGTTYHFQLLSKDKRGNIAQSPDYTMLTQQQDESVLNLILKTLEDTFSWVGKVGNWFGGVFGKLFSK